MNSLNNLLRLLLENQIEFVLIGGFAGVVHGSTQVTRDLDICAAVNPDSIQKLRDTLKDLNPKHRMNPSFKPSFLEEPKNLVGINNIYLETEFGVLDIISEVIGVGNFERLAKESVEIDFLGLKCRVISIEDLIASKREMNRDKDKLAVLELTSILKLRKKS